MPSWRDRLCARVGGEWLPCERFVYEGFLPHKKGRQTRLKAFAAETRTTVSTSRPTAS